MPVINFYFSSPSNMSLDFQLGSILSNMVNVHLSVSCKCTAPALPYTFLIYIVHGDL